MAFKPLVFLPLLLLLLLLLLLSAAVAVRESTTSDLQASCPAEITIKDKEAVNYTRLTDEEVWKHGRVYVHPQDMEGVSVHVVVNSKSPSSTVPEKDVKEVFFPFTQDTCFTDNTVWWWEVYVSVWVTPRNDYRYDPDDEEHDLHFVVDAGECLARCTVQLQDKGRKTLDWWLLIGYGMSSWARNIDGEKCKRSGYIPTPLQEYNSCLKPPATTQDTTPDNTEDTPPPPDNTEDTPPPPDNTFNIVMITVLSVMAGAVGVLGFFVSKQVYIMEQKSG